MRVAGDQMNSGFTQHLGGGLDPEFSSAICFEEPMKTINNKKDREGRGGETI